MHPASPPLRALLATAVASLLALAAVGPAAAHGDVTPQAVDTKSLQQLGATWRTENPYRKNADAIKIGASAYNQNCARCHGLGVVSGGLAPDLRFLEASDYGDEWYMERFRHGYTQDGVTKMPGFEEVLGQKAGWAIRTYIETRPESGALDAHVKRLTEIRDLLAKGGADEAALKPELETIYKAAKTHSGAPIADSAARQAFLHLNGTPDGQRLAADALTIGLSAAH